MLLRSPDQVGDLSWVDPRSGLLILQRRKHLNLSSSVRRRHLSWLKFEIRNVEEAIPIAEEMLKNEDYDKYGDDYWS